MEQRGKDNGLKLRQGSDRLDRESKMRLTRIGARIFVALVLAGLIATAALSGGVPLAPLEPPWQQKSFPGAFSKDRSLKVEYGYLASFLRGLSGAPESDTIHLYSLLTGTEREFGFWVEGASSVWIDDVAVTPDGKILVAGSWDQSASGPIFDFVDELDSTGDLVKHRGPCRLRT